MVVKEECDTVVLLCGSIDVLKTLFFKTFKHKIDIGYTLYFSHKKRFLLLNIPKTDCKIVGICYNKCVAIFDSSKLANHKK